MNSPIRVPCKGSLGEKTFWPKSPKTAWKLQKLFFGQSSVEDMSICGRGGGIIQIPGCWVVPPAPLLSTRGNPAYKCMLVTPFPQNPLFLDILHEGRCPYSSSDWKSSIFKGILFLGESPKRTKKMTPKQGFWTTKENVTISFSLKL